MDYTYNLNRLVRLARTYDLLNTNKDLGPKKRWSVFLSEHVDLTPIGPNERITRIEPEANREGGFLLWSNLGDLRVYPCRVLTNQADNVAKLVLKNSVSSLNQGWSWPLTFKYDPMSKCINLVAPDLL